MHWEIVLYKVKNNAFEQDSDEWNIHASKLTSHTLWKQQHSVNILFTHVFDYRGKWSPWNVEITKYKTTPCLCDLLPARASNTTSIQPGNKSSSNPSQVPSDNH